MVSDAESHAEEDRKQRELAEARNIGENAAYQAEKAIADAGDKVDQETKDEVESAVKDVRSVLDSGSLDEVNAKTEALEREVEDHRRTEAAHESGVFLLGLRNGHEREATAAVSIVLTISAAWSRSLVSSSRNAGPTVPPRRTSTARVRPTEGVAPSTPWSTSLGKVCTVVTGVGGVPAQ